MTLGNMGNSTAALVGNTPNHFRCRQLAFGLVIILGCLSVTRPVFATQVEFVPDEATALAIGKAVLKPLVGADKLGEKSVEGNKSLPFYASRAGSGYNFWYVENAPPARLKWASPVIRVEIEKSSARIQYASNGIDHQWLVLTVKKESDKQFVPKVEQWSTIGGAKSESVWTLHGMGLGQKKNWIDISPTGFVPDAATAIAVAKAILKPLVGAAAIDGPHALPFYAALDPGDNAIWRVENAPPFRKKWNTPVMTVQIEKRTGRIIEASDGSKNVWRSASQ